MVQREMKSRMPVTEEVSTFQFMIDGTFKVTACQRRYQPYDIPGELIKMIMAAAARQSTPIAESETLAPKIRAAHPLPRD